MENVTGIEGGGGHEGRTTVVTGSASGIGAALRRHLEAAGGTVVGVDLADAEVVADLSRPEGRAAAVQAVLERTGGAIDGLAVCAGLGPHVAERSLLVAVNHFGAVAMLDGLHPALVAGDRPAAVAIASNSMSLVPVRDPRLLEALAAADEAEATALVTAYDGPSVYAMTKIGLTRAVRARAARWAGSGVRINAVAPGPVTTPLLQGSLDDPELGPLVDALPVPLGRRGTPDEIAAVLAFLLSPAAGYVHGSVVFADGGTDALVRPDAF